MQTYRRLVIASLIATYLLIFIGGLVRVSGAGLGCPDWPNCFGRWIPPTSIDQIPPDIDPTSFNLTLAWIEYGNRLVGVIVGLIIVAMSLVAIMRLRDRPLLLWGSIGSALLVAFQGWQGSMVVYSDLQPLVVTTHLLIALLLASLLIVLLAEANRGASDPAPIKSRASKLLLVLWCASLVQVIFGTQLRGQLDTLAETVPLLGETEWLNQASQLYLLHAVIGFLLVFGTIVIAMITKQLLPRSAKPAIVALLIVAAAQLALGIGVFGVGLQPLIQLFHLWLASIYIGILLWLYVGEKYHLFKKFNSGQRLPVVAIAANVTVLAILGAWVVGQAHASRIALPMVQAAPQFSFPDQTGGRFSSDSLQGRLTVVDFIFTHCKGICPTLRVEMSKLYERYAYSDKLQLVSFSVDPDRDSIPVLSSYAAECGVRDRRWLFLRTDSLPQISQLCEAGFLVSGDLPGGHSSKLVLIDRQGVIRGYYEHSDPSEMQLLRTHIDDLSRLDQ